MSTPARPLLLSTYYETIAERIDCLIHLAFNGRPDDAELIESIQLQLARLAHLAPRGHRTPAERQIRLGLQLAVVMGKSSNAGVRVAHWQDANDGYHFERAKVAARFLRKMADRARVDELLYRTRPAPPTAPSPPPVPSLAPAAPAKPAPAAPPAAPVPTTPPMPTAAMMSVRELAEALGVEQKLKTVESAVRRFAKKHRDSEVENPTPREREAHKLYRVAVVWPFLTSKLPDWSKDG